MFRVGYSRGIGNGQVFAMSWGVVDSYSWWWNVLECIVLAYNGVTPWQAAGWLTLPKRIIHWANYISRGPILCAAWFWITQILVIVAVSIAWVGSHALTGHSLEWRGTHSCCRLTCWSPFREPPFSASILSFIMCSFHLYFCDYVCSLILCYLCVWQE